MKWLLKPLQWIYCIYAFIIFTILMLVIFPVALVAGFFGRIKGGNFIYKLCRLWADTWFFLIGIRTKIIVEAPHDNNGPCIFVANHISYLDAAFLVKVFRRPMRPLGKMEMSKIPV